MICNYCKKEFKNAGGLASHSRSCKLNPDSLPWTREAWNKGKKGVQVPWNKGKTGVMTAWNKGLTNLEGHPHSEETKQRLSDVAKERGLGGYVKGSGRGKKGWYKGFFCDSSWELAYVIYCLDHGINIQRNTEKRTYVYEGKERNYIPDFIVEGELVEIKGYKTEQWLAKLKANQDVKVLYEKDLQDVLTYVKLNYGNDFVRYYDTGRCR